MDPAYMSHHYILIFHPKDRSVLTVLESGEKQLPAMNYEHALGSADQVCDYVIKSFNFSFQLVILRYECEEMQKCMCKGSDGDITRWEQYFPKLFIFDIPREDVPNTAPDGFSWTPQSQVDKIHLDPRIDSVGKYLIEYRDHGLGIHADRLYQYAFPGWFDKACDWIRDRLEENGHEVACVRQLKRDSLSCVLRVTSSMGERFYFKAVPFVVFNDEIKITCALGEVMPKYFTTPIAFDTEKGWMIMRDHGPTLRRNSAYGDVERELVQDVLTAWGKVQKDSIKVMDKLVKAGVPVRDMKWLQEEVEKMVGSEEWFEMQKEDMDEQERELYTHEDYKRSFRAYVKELCAEMSPYEVPLGLVHGDLSFVNIIGDHDGPPFVFIDFGNTYLSFPFIDLISLADFGKTELADLRFYLKFWTEYEGTEEDPIKRLEELVAVTGKVQSLLAEVEKYMDIKNAEEGHRLSIRRILPFNNSSIVATFLSK